MPAREINPFTALTRIRSVSQDTMIDEQSSASGHAYASDRSAIGAGLCTTRGNNLKTSFSYTSQTVKKRCIFWAIWGLWGVFNVPSEHLNWAECQLASDANGRWITHNPAAFAYLQQCQICGQMSVYPKDSTCSSHLYQWANVLFFKMIPNIIYFWHVRDSFTSSRETRPKFWGKADLIIKEIHTTILHH